MPNWSYVRGVSEMFLTTMIWGSVPIFAIWSGLPSSVFVFYRVLIAAPLMALIVISGRRINTLALSRHLWSLVLSGVFLALNWVLLFYAVQFTAVANAVMLYYTGPIIAILLAPIVVKERLPKWIAIPGTMVMGGILLIFYQGVPEANSMGLVFGLLAGVTYGALAVTSKLATRSYLPDVVVLYQTIISIALLVPFAMAEDYTLSMNVLAILVTVGVVHTALALRLWYDALKLIPLHVASVLSYLDPVFATFFALMLLSQVPALNTVAGGALILIAGIMTALKARVRN
jgi:drug/metabolite transporter (DMT)-like permease